VEAKVKEVAMLELKKELENEKNATSSEPSRTRTERGAWSFIMASDYGADSPPANLQCWTRVLRVRFGAEYHL
jgi:hypothetical protein